MPEQQTWRELLGKIISNPIERQRIASAVEVKEVTLQRWSLEKANPHPRNLHQLVATLPQFHDLLVSLIQQEFPEFENASASMPKSIPTIIYSMVLDAYANHAEMLSKGTILSLVVRGIAPHIDPNGTSSFVSLAYCAPFMRSLIVSKMQVLYQPTDLDLYQHTLLLGAEFLGSHVASVCQPAIIQEIANEHIFPLSQVERKAGSIAAWPIQRHGNVAGVLIVSSRYPYFFSQLRVKIIVEYVRLLTLAFRESDFLACSTLRFRFMASDQREFVRTLRSRIPVTTYPYREAERITYQQIEAEMAEGDENEHQYE